MVGFQHQDRVPLVSAVVGIRSSNRRSILTLAGITANVTAGYGFRGIRLFAAVVDAVVDNVEHSGVQANGSRYEPADVRVISGSSFDQGRDIFSPVTARGKEVREHDDFRRAASDALRKGLSDCGLGEFHVGGFDNRILRLGGKTIGGSVKHLIALTATRAVIDNDDTSDTELIGHLLDYAGTATLSSKAFRI